MSKIRKGDEVVINTGKDKGKRGTVLRVLESGHVLVEGANKVKKHAKPNPMKGINGGIMEKRCRLISPMLLCLIAPPKRASALASRCSKMAAKCVSSNRAVKLLTYKEASWLG